MHTITLLDESGFYEIYLEGLGSWNDYEGISKLLTKELNCYLIEERDMITDKEILFEFQEIRFIFRHHYVFGNYIKTKNLQDVPILEKLANDVIKIIAERVLQLQEGEDEDNVYL